VTMWVPVWDCLGLFGAVWGDCLGLFGVCLGQFGCLFGTVWGSLGAYLEQFGMSVCLRMFGGLVLTV
jgi:hypothetical protein